MNAPEISDELRAFVRQVIREELGQTDERGGIAAVEAWTGLDRSTVFRKCRAGVFPAPEYVGSRRVWLKRVVEEWIRDQQSNPRPGARGIAAQKKKGTNEHDDPSHAASRRSPHAGRRVTSGDAAHAAPPEAASADAHRSPSERAEGDLPDPAARAEAGALIRKRSDERRRSP